MNVKQIIIDFLYPGLLDELDTYKNNVSYYKQLISLNDKQYTKDIITFSEENEHLLDKISLLNNNISELKEQNEYLLDSVVSEIDNWLSEKYKIIPNKVYKNKRKFDGKIINVFLNQLITPDAFEVLKFKKKLKLNSDDYNNVKEATDKVAKHTTWTGDDTLYNMVDFYNYPEEVLVIKLADCECIANTITSLFHKKIGTGYGFYNHKGYSETDKGLGHAFNVFVWNNDLYIAEGTGTRAVLHRYNPTDKNEQYHLLFVITKDYTYKCTDENIEFGYLVNW